MYIYTIYNLTSIPSESFKHLLKPKREVTGKIWEITKINASTPVLK